MPHLASVEVLLNACTSQAFLKVDHSTVGLITSVRGVSGLIMKDIKHAANV